MLDINGCGLNIYACQGAKVKVTGTPDLPNLLWRADSDNPLQKESNEYSDFKRMIVKELDKKASKVKVSVTDGNKTKGKSKPRTHINSDAKIELWNLSK